MKTPENKPCLNCGKIMSIPLSYSLKQWIEKKCCSIKCGALKRKARTLEHIKNQSGDKNGLWKGDAVGYGCMHTWVVRWKGKPSLCEKCGTTTAKKYEWANIDHKYQRILDSYIRLCTSCHRNYDYDNNLSDIGSKWGSIKNKKQ